MRGPERALVPPGPHRNKATSARAPDSRATVTRLAVLAAVFLEFLGHAWTQAGGRPTTKNARMIPAPFRGNPAGALFGNRSGFGSGASIGDDFRRPRRRHHGRPRVEALACRSAAGAEAIATAITIRRPMECTCPVARGIIYGLRRRLPLLRLRHLRRPLEAHRHAAAPAVRALVDHLRSGRATLPVILPMRRNGRASRTQNRCCSHRKGAMVLCMLPDRRRRRRRGRLPRSASFVSFPPVALSHGPPREAAGSPATGALAVVDVRSPMARRGGQVDPNVDMEFVGRRRAVVLPGAVSHPVPVIHRRPGGDQPAPRSPPAAADGATGPRAP